MCLLVAYLSSSGLTLRTNQRNHIAKPRKKPIEVLVVLADLHAGSSVSLMPSKYKTIEGMTIKPNAIQKWLGRCWEDAQKFIGEVTGNDPFAIVTNGDLIEGDHHRSTQVVSADVGDHMEIAKILLKPLTSRAERLFVVKGTECHTGNTEQAIASSLGAETNPDTGYPIFDRLTLDIKGTRCVFRHHIATTGKPWSEANAMSAELAAEQLNAARNGEPLPRVLCCAHRHRAGHFSDTAGMAVISPPWQALTRFGHKVVGSARTWPGVYILDWRDKGRNELPHPHWRTYQQPQAKAVTL